jgi:hypothetical protein
MIQVDDVDPDGCSARQAVSTGSVANSAASLEILS